MMPPAADLSLQSLQEDIDSESADVSANRNPLKRAAGMHRMAYHRRRIRIILGKALQQAEGPGAPIAHYNLKSLSRQCLRHMKNLHLTRKRLGLLGTLGTWLAD